MNRTNAALEPRARDRKKTESEILLALERIQASGKKVTIAAVAKEAGVTPSLLHNRYPDFAERIRKIAGKSTRTQRDEKHDAFLKEKARNRELREKIDSLTKDLETLASINESLRTELVLQAAIASSKVTKIR